MAIITTPPKIPLGRLRKYFITGILFLAPLTLTFWVLQFLINKVDGWLAIHEGKFLFFVPGRFHPDELLGVHIPGLGVAAVLLLTLVCGVFASNFIGGRLILLGEKIVTQIPLVRSIYNGLKQFFGIVLDQERKKNLGQVVLVEFPHTGIWSLAFKTAPSYSKIQQNFKKTMVSLLVPNTPNPTTGFYVVAAEDDLIPLNITTEEAFKLILSFGILNPDLAGTSKASDSKPN